MGRGVGEHKGNRRENTVGPNRDRLPVGVDLGDRWSQYCILGVEGETLAEGQLRTTQEDVGEFFRVLTAITPISKSNPSIPAWVLRHPPRVPLSKILKHRMLRANANPNQFRLPAEMNDVGVLVLFFNCYAIILESLNESADVARDRRPGSHRLGLYEYVCNNARI
jgi:hypothetical protein